MKMRRKSSSRKCEEIQFSSHLIGLYIHVMAQRFLVCGTNEYRIGNNYTQTGPYIATYIVEISRIRICLNCF